MIQYIGLSFTLEAGGAPRAVATVVDRKAHVLGSGSTPVGGVTAPGASSLEVRPGEWIRAGSLALKDAYFLVPGRVRRFWGFSLAGPAGWVALDPSLEPLSPVRITPRPCEDFLAWLSTYPRLRSHIYAVLTPKDYFRFAVSGALAIDATQAAGFGLLEAGSTRWSTARMNELGLIPTWFPPVFDSAVATGRISEEGIRRTGLPGGLWVVAGSETGAGALVSAAEGRTGVLLASASDPSTLHLQCLAAGLLEPSPPEGFESSPAPVAGHRTLARRITAGSGPEAEAQARKAVGEAVETLQRSGAPGLNPPGKLVVDYRGSPPAWLQGLLAGGPLPAEVSPFAGVEDPGVAFLAAVAQGGFRTLEDLRRKLQEAREEKEKAGGEAGPSPNMNTEKGR